MQTRVPKRRIGLLFDPLTTDIFSLAHEVPLFLAHPHPTFGVALKILACLWRHGKPAIPNVLTGRRSMGYPHRGPPNGPTWTMSLRLRLRASAGQSQDRQREN